MAAITTTTLFTIAEGGNGRSMFASTRILRGTIIHTETSLTPPIPQSEAHEEHKYITNYQSITPPEQMIYNTLSHTSCCNVPSVLSSAKALGVSASSANSSSPTTLATAHLIARVNAFEDGLLYQVASNYNHSCNPNVYHSATADGVRTFRAVVDIEAGQELLISYLGVFNLAPKQVRRQKLLTEKFFLCSCSRCSSLSCELETLIPCPVCHIRCEDGEGGGKILLPEDVLDNEDVVFVSANLGTEKCDCERAKRASLVTEKKRKDFTILTIPSAQAARRLLPATSSQRTLRLG